MGYKPLWFTEITIPGLVAWFVDVLFYLRILYVSTSKRVMLIN
jgi:hypothetical protein